MEFEWNKAGVEPGKEAILENMFLTVGVAFMASAPKEKVEGTDWSRLWASDSK